MKWYTWLVRLYPPAWRTRYGDEFQALLEECSISLPDVIDIIIGAVDARLLFNLGVQSNWRFADMMSRRGLAIIGSMVMAAAVLDLSAAAIAAFAWFEGNVMLAALLAAGASAATAGFVVIGARRLHHAWGRAA